MDIPNQCNYCGSEYDGSTCWNCLKMKNYATHFSKCFIYSIIGYGKLSYKDGDSLTFFQLADLKNIQNNRKTSIIQNNLSKEKNRSKKGPSLSELLMGLKKRLSRITESATMM